MKKITAFIITAILGFAFQVQARPFLAIGAPPNAEHVELHRQLIALNKGWLTRTPDFSLPGAGRPTANDRDLIKRHLLLVIGQLEQADTAHLKAAQQTQRFKHIQTLREYMEKGEFPQNVFVQGYRPVFIDPRGTHCAVGHLIAVSGTPELAIAINEEHQLDFLQNIKTQGLAEWQVKSGLSFEELALIQPSYHSKELSYPTEIEALILGDSTALKKRLQEDPSLVTARCGGKTLLHFAAAAGDLELVKLLIEKGADLHAVTKLSKVTTPPSPAADSSKKENSETAPDFRRPRSSSTLYTVRWNQPTLESKMNRGGRRMGTYGRVFSTKSGVNIAGLLGDFVGGVVDKNALYFVTPRKLSNSRWMKSAPYVEKNQELIQLNENRALVADWLKEQGLK